MAVETKTIKISAKSETMADITSQVKEAVSKSSLKSGTATLFVSGSTAAISTIEYEPGAVSDFFDGLEQFSPTNKPYRHHEKWHDDNGRSHVRSTLVGPSLTIPFTNKKLTLGTWQQIVLIELDTSDRTREITLQLLGE